MKRINRVLEIIFLILFGIYLVSQVPRDSMLFLQFPEWYEQAMFWSLVGVASLKLLFKGLYYRKKRLLGIILLLIVVGLYFLVWSYYPETYVTLPFIAVLTAGCFDIDHRWVLRMFVATVGTFFLVTLIAGIIGAVTDLIYFDGEVIRSSLGGVYPTDMASKLLFVLMALWVAKKKLPDWVMLLLGLGSMWFSWFVTRSDTSFICSITFELIIIYYLLEQHVFRQRHRLVWISKVVNCILTVSFPLCAAIFFSLALFYLKGSAFVLQLDVAFSNRIRLTIEAIQKYGVNLIGTPFEMIGHGASVISNNNYYNMVDSSYARVLVYYGSLLFAMLCVLWIIMVRKALKNRNRRLAFIIGLVAFHSISEHHFLGLGYNIFLILPFSGFAVSEETQAVEKRAVRECLSPKWFAVILTGIISIVGGIFVLPKALTLLRTLTYLGNHGRENDWIAAILIIMFFAVIILAVWSIYRIIQAVLNKRRGKILVKNSIPLLISLTGIALALLCVDHLLQNRVQRIENVLQEEQKILSIAAAASNGGICVGTEPAVYQKYMKGIQNSVFAGEELARFRNHTVLLSADKEYNLLLQTGYLFLQVSDEHAIYTDEQSVIKALSNAGYHLTGYYSIASEVDLEYEAGLNGLLYSTDEGILVDGNVNSLGYGPYIDLYAGKYTVKYELVLPDSTTLQDNSLVCTMEVSSYWGQNVLTEKQILCSEFDENGKLTAVVSFVVPKNGARYVEFKAFIAEGQQVIIRKISYVRTPDYDIHAVYDSNLHLVREEYYSLEGKKTMNAGFYAREYEYDKHGNNSCLRYFDLEDEPMLYHSSYFEIRKIFNNKKVVRGEYYGTDGKLITVSAGEAIYEFNYDAKGHRIAEYYYGAAEQPVITTRGYASVARGYDEDYMLWEKYFGIAGEPYLMPAGYCGIEREYDNEGHLILQQYLNEEGKNILREDGYSKVEWEYDEEGKAIREVFYDDVGSIVDDQDLNLAMGLSPAWSEWMTPYQNILNSCFNIGSFILGEKELGDVYTCQIEIEFRDVTVTDNEPFRFRTQGAVDGEWNKGNIWNSDLIYLDSPPEDGIYYYTSTVQITESNVDAGTFNIGFRCDNWASGSFRVNHVKVEKGSEPSTWDPGI